MFDSLNGYEIQKIDKVVVYYDELNSSKGLAATEILYI